MGGGGEADDVDDGAVEHIFECPRREYQVCRPPLETTRYIPLDFDTHTCIQTTPSSLPCSLTRNISSYLSCSCKISFSYPDWLFLLPHLLPSFLVPFPPSSPTGTLHFSPFTFHFLHSRTLTDSDSDSFSLSSHLTL